MRQNNIIVNNINKQLRVFFVWWDIRRDSTTTFLGIFLFGFLYFSQIRISLLHLFVFLSLSRLWGLLSVLSTYDPLRQPGVGFAFEDLITTGHE
jgi:hypothetical protein